MYAGEMLGGLYAILGLFIVVFVIAMLSFMMIRSRDDAMAAIAEHDDAIAECRNQRKVIMGQLLSMFGEGNPQSSNLGKLLSLYDRANTPQRESEWEKKYLPVIESFMGHARANLDPSLAGSWHMANKALADNEAALTRAREARNAALAEAASFDEPPKSYAVGIGDAISGLIVKHRDKIQPFMEDDGNGGGFDGRR